MLRPYSVPTVTGGVFMKQTSKSVHRRFVHSTFQTHRDYTPTRATQCANAVWSDLVVDYRSVSSLQDGVGKLTSCIRDGKTLSVLSRLVGGEASYESGTTGGSQTLRVRRCRDADHYGWRVPHQARAGVDLRQRHPAWLWASVLSGAVSAGGRQAVP